MSISPEAALKPVVSHSTIAVAKSNSYNADDEQDVNLSEDGVVEEDHAPDLSLPAIRHYFATRVSTLLKIYPENLPLLNPIPACREMTLRHWNFFFMGMLAWLSASFDFFLTAVSGTYIASSFNVSTADITWGLSAVLMVRSAGALIFGYWTDNYSRKWPYITAALMFMALQIGTGFCKTYQQFLAVRALSGIAMGGTYATAAATSLDDAPVKARSFLSGLFFTAYGLGLVFAAIFWRAFAGTKETWRSLFWFSAGIPAVLVVWRLVYPETKFFERLLEAKRLIKEDQIKAGTYVELSFREKVKNGVGLCKKYWVLFVYLVLLLSFSNFLAHASQDMYPTMLRKQLMYSEDAITVAIVISNLGGVFGSVIIGTFMEVLGRRLSLIICCIMGGAACYPAVMIQSSSAVLGAGFWLFFCVLGVWGVMPAHLSELSPPDARALVSGLAYQLGNLAASASSTIETRLASNWPLEFDSEGVATKLDYAKTIAVFTGAVFVYGFFITLVGHEKFHRSLSSPIINRYMGRVIENEKRTVSGDFEDQSSSGAVSKSSKQDQ